MCKALKNGLGLRLLGTWLAVGQVVTMMGSSYAEELPLTRNVPIEQFQNRQEDVKPYNFDAPPEGMFRSIEVAEGFEEELGFRRQNEIVPVNPISEIHSGSKPVFIVFQLYPHFQSFQVFGVCYPEAVPELEPETVVARDTMYIATEDESGYLEFFPPTGGWKPGKYKVDIHVGEQIIDISLMGTMRLTVASQDPATPSSSNPLNPSFSNSGKP
jgi:hypothetical protein